MPKQVTPALFPHLAAKIDQVIFSVWKDTTLAGYQDGVDQFIAFCTCNSIHSSLYLPANEFLLCSFAAFESGSRSSGAITNDMSGIRAWHILNNVPYFGGIRLSYVIKGAHSNTPTNSKCPPRPPVTTQMLNLLHSHLDPSNHLDTACLAVSDCALWGQACLGEFLPKSQGKFSARFFPVVLNLRPTSSSGLSQIPRSLQLNLVIPWFPAISGHSFCIGGTTELLLCGVPPHIIKTLGRWSSDAFLLYWCCLKEIAPLHTELLGPRISSISSS
ncbi:hypothetical protein DEU56DRAFT_906174 [Suillus clintonianus]|uniref:uncharacterized protein n=1 Tax=Suillus clintonianus TaxID=1904413 RepID=UPI001B882661|nr:uncharacterized protein DEU56DRAFT_906174 [Suillus clintonianus]KAG2157540.1 hypothetical protein DEU56DRAFT_906174 [Suillus clintonianus]